MTASQVKEIIHRIKIEEGTCALSFCATCPLQAQCVKEEILLDDILMEAELGGTTL